MRSAFSNIKVYATYGDGSKTEETILTVNKLTDDFDAAFRPLMINVSSYSWTYGSSRNPGAYVKSEQMEC